VCGSIVKEAGVRGRESKGGKERKTNNSRDAVLFKLPRVSINNQHEYLFSYPDYHTVFNDVFCCLYFELSKNCQCNTDEERYYRFETCRPSERLYVNIFIAPEK